MRQSLTKKIRSEAEQNAERAKERARIIKEIVEKMGQMDPKDSQYYSYFHDLSNNLLEHAQSVNRCLGTAMTLNRIRKECEQTPA